MKQEFENIIIKYNSSKFIQSPFIQDFAKYGEKIYLVAVFLLTIYYGYFTTMLRSRIMFVEIMYLCVVPLIWIKILFGYAKNIKYLCYALLILLVLQYVSNYIGGESTMIMGLMILGAYEVDFKKILKVYIVAISMLSLVAFVVAKMGITEYLIYDYEGRRLRYALGSVYPTDFMCHILFITLALLYLLKDKMKITFTVIYTMLILALYYLTDARTASWCALLEIGIWIVLNNRNSKLLQAVADKKRFVNSLKYVCIYSPVIGAVGFMIVCAFEYLLPGFKRFFPAMIADRIEYTVIAFKEYGIPFLPSGISMHGAGGTTKLVEDYFFIDSSYMWILYVHGMIMLLIVFAILIAIGYKFRNDWFMLTILLIIAIDSTIEHHLIDLSYNVFLYALIADCGIGRYESKKCKRDSRSFYGAS